MTGAARDGGTRMSARSVAAAVATAVATAAVMLALVAASRAPLVVHPAPAAMVRLAWSARPERIERCTRVSAEELAALPAHMRQHVVCEGTTARYAVAVSHEGVVLLADTLRGGGLRHDRQLYYFRELRVPAGRSVIDVRVTRLDSSTARRAARDDDDESRTTRAGERHDDDERGEEDDDDGGGDEAGAHREREERRRRQQDAIPPLLVLRDTVTLAPREVMLVSYDRATHRFRILRHQASARP